MWKGEADVRTNDKVRINSGPYAGQRAVVEKIGASSIHVRLRDSRSLVTVDLVDLGNFSAAARKAWKTMPARSVGRPRGRTTSRRSVTLRLDESIWKRFVALEANGDIPDRSTLFEDLLGEKLTQLEKAARDKKTHA